VIDALSDWRVIVALWAIAVALLIVFNRGASK